MEVNVFSDKSISNQKITTVVEYDKSLTTGISFDVEVPIGHAGTEIILTIDEIRRILRLLEEEHCYINRHAQAN